MHLWMQRFVSEMGGTHPLPVTYNLLPFVHEGPHLVFTALV